MYRLPFLLVLSFGCSTGSVGSFGDPPAADPTGDSLSGDPSPGDSPTGDSLSGDPSPGDPPTGDSRSGDPTAGDPLVTGDPGPTTTVTPSRIDDVLVNPGIGFADFHFGWWCNLPPITYTPDVCATRVRDNWPANYPTAGTAYFRWHWSAIEPTREQIDFDMIDAAILSANQLGETFSFRVMTIDEGDQGIPAWLTSDPYNVAGSWLASDGSTTFWPDVRDTTFQAEHQRLVNALAARYDGHPALDHVDIGSVGCWGEWNTACLTDGGGLFEVYNPAGDTDRDAIEAAYQTLISHFLDAFETTPVVMLGLGSGGGREVDVMVHALEGGTGWRVDCWGDWDLFSSAWSHQDDLYPDMITNLTAAFAGFPNVWQQAPVQLEICGTIPGWLSAGYTTDVPDGEVTRTFQFALDQHASVLNGKSTDIPSEYVAAIDELLKENGYRFVIDSFSHPATVSAGGSIRFDSTWSNIGVAPIYIRRDLVYRLRGTSRTETFTSPQDIRTWMPGNHPVSDSFALPGDLPAGTYQVEVALPDRAGTAPDTPPLVPLHLAIEGRGTDGWYALSTIDAD